MLSQSAREEAKLNAMQRMWQTKRGLTSALFDDYVETEELVPVPETAGVPRQFSIARSSSPQPLSKDEEPEVYVWETLQEHILVKSSEVETTETPSFLVLDASTLGDFPARYKICALEKHQMPAVGVYIDKRIIPGFKYKVRPLPSIGQKATAHKCLFNDKALVLKSIGRGYARRFTFEASPNKLTSNKNYFWSDNRPEGYAFELELVSEGDRFTIFDINQEAQGTVEILKLEGFHHEISSVCTGDNVQEKRANVKFTGKVEFYETGVAKPMLIEGVAVAVKKRNKDAEIVKMINVNIRKHRYTLLPGVKKEYRRVTVRGEDIKDVPTKYSMTGLEPYEMPVVGTYVDPRVIPGFHYKVRPNDRQNPLFGGRALRLLSIGMGYAKRLTFQPDSHLHPDNYLWSDNHPDGLGLQIQALHEGMTFSVWAGEQRLGEASVFRTDQPQMEKMMQKVPLSSGKCAIEKFVHVDVMCHVKIALTEGGAVDEHLIRVYGVAVVRKEPNRNEAKVIRVEHVGMDSQLNVLFAQSHLEITFYPV